MDRCISLVILRINLMMTRDKKSCNVFSINIYEMYDLIVKQI